MPFNIGVHRVLNKESDVNNSDIWLEEKKKP